jgi:mono/diheme cytochrome c family protein
VSFRAGWIEPIYMSRAIVCRMCRARHVFVCAVSLIGVFAASEIASAQDEHLGIIEYEVACLPCHGIEGRGDGPVAEKLKVPPADLTQIAKKSGGAFPAAKVAEIIDGRAAVAAHMRREMPVWGKRYRKATAPDESFADIDARARMQIDALVNYLESIQER